MPLKDIKVDKFLETLDNKDKKKTARYPSQTTQESIMIKEISDDDELDLDPVFEPLTNSRVQNEPIVVRELTD